MDVSYFTLKFVYCVFTISGHCVEFNVPGGVIQDQRSASCKEPFPRCANIYNSWEAYKCKVKFYTRVHVLAARLIIQWTRILYSRCTMGKSQCVLIYINLDQHIIIVHLNPSRTWADSSRELKFINKNCIQSHVTILVINHYNVISIVT